MPTTIASPPPEPVETSAWPLEDEWGYTANGAPYLIRRKALPEVWGILPNGMPDIVEDDSPVDSSFTVYQCRLLVDSLYASWTSPTGKPFVAYANVGLFFEQRKPPVVPDMMLSLDIPPSTQLESDQYRRTYATWMMGKNPEVVVEIVSKTVNDEDTDKLHKYERIRIPYYVIYDPELYLGGEALRVFELHRGRYRRAKSNALAELGLKLTLWKGTYNTNTATWLRWCDGAGNLIPTAQEVADKQKFRADAAEERAETERKNAAAERDRANASEEKSKLLAAKLKELGVEL